MPTHVSHARATMSAHAPRATTSTAVTAPSRVTRMAAESISAHEEQRAHADRERLGERLGEHRLHACTIGAGALEVAEQPLGAPGAACAQRRLVVFAHEPVRARPAL